MATAESTSFATGTAKAPRRIVIPEFTQYVTLTQSVNTPVVQANPTAKFVNPVYVNPGEFVALTVKHVGTVGTGGVIAYNVSFDYGWE